MGTRFHAEEQYQFLPQNQGPDFATEQILRRSRQEKEDLMRLSEETAQDIKGGYDRLGQGLERGYDTYLKSERNARDQSEHEARLRQAKLDEEASRLGNESTQLKNQEQKARHDYDFGAVNGQGEQLTPQQLAEENQAQAREAQTPNMVGPPRSAGAVAPRPRWQQKLETEEQRATDTHNMAKEEHALGLKQGEASIRGTDAQIASSKAQTALAQEQQRLAKAQLAQTTLQGKLAVGEEGLAMAYERKDPQAEADILADLRASGASELHLAAAQRNAKKKLEQEATARRLQDSTDPVASGSIQTAQALGQKLAKTKKLAEYAQEYSKTSSVTGSGGDLDAAQTKFTALLDPADQERIASKVSMNGLVPETRSTKMQRIVNEKIAQAEGDLEQLKKQNAAQPNATVQQQINQLELQLEEAKAANGDQTAKYRQMQRKRKEGNATYLEKGGGAKGTGGAPVIRPGMMLPRANQG